MATDAALVAAAPGDCRASATGSSMDTLRHFATVLRMPACFSSVVLKLKELKSRQKYFKLKKL